MDADAHSGHMQPQFLIRKVMPNDLWPDGGVVVFAQFPFVLDQTWRNKGEWVAFCRKTVCLPDVRLQGGTYEVFFELQDTDEPDDRDGRRRYDSDGTVDESSTDGDAADASDGSDGAADGEDLELDSLLGDDDEDDGCAAGSGGPAGPNEVGDATRPPDAEGACTSGEDTVSPSGSSGSRGGQGDLEPARGGRGGRGGGRGGRGGPGGGRGGRGGRGVVVVVAVLLALCPQAGLLPRIVPQVRAVLGTLTTVLGTRALVASRLFRQAVAARARRSVAIWMTVL